MGDARAPEVLVLSFTDHARDPRVDRQIRFLSDSFDVVAAGVGDPAVPEAEFVRLAPRPKPLTGQILGASRLLGRRYETYYWSTRVVTECLERLSGRQPRLVVANDIDTLPVALRIAAGAPVLFDAHEYAPLEFEDRLGFRLFYKPYRSYLCRTYIPRVQAMTTVCERIAEEYERDTGVRPEVVWNAPEFAELEPAPTEQRRIRLVHHGGAQRSRRIEGMIRMMDHLDERFELSLVLVATDEAYMRRLRREAAGDPRIRFLDPVPMRRLPAFLNRFDVGVFLLPPVNFNYRHALPNKLFEFVQARLAVAIGPTPEMARIVERHELGLVAADFSPPALAARLSELTPARIGELKRNAHSAARELSAEPGRRRLLALARRAIEGAR